MEVIGTTPWTGEIEPRQEQRSRVEPGAGTQSRVWNGGRGTDAYREVGGRQCLEHIVEYTETIKGKETLINCHLD